mmetsp:Transcript_117689/g.375061  ORF Transcript_117689/g.375061 Transcript_117689/m.375061 type:complete len:124 (+) Transcript_117689:245-616(+)
MQHLVSNLEVVWEDSDLDSCKTRAMFHNPICVWWFPFFRPFFNVGGWYNHTLVRGNDRVWRIAELREEIAYNQAVSEGPSAVRVDRVRPLRVRALSACHDIGENRTIGHWLRDRGDVIPHTRL